MKLETNEKKSQKAKYVLLEKEGGPLMTCDWVKFVFLHYEIDPELLQPEIPYELDLFDGKAYISLVAFTLENFCLAKGGIWTKWMTAPVATHRYFNVRTYVRQGQADGIYFMNEWISNRLCAAIGKTLYGLPVQYGQLNYQNDCHVHLQGSVKPENIKGLFKYETAVDPNENLTGVQENSLDEFLLERYVAYVKGNGVKRFFHIWHHPWQQQQMNIKNIENDLFPKLGKWGNKVKMVKAHYSPGVMNVWMGKPNLVRA